MGLAGNWAPRTRAAAAAFPSFLAHPWGGELSPETPIRARTLQGAQQGAEDRQELAGRQEEEMLTAGTGRPAHARAGGSGAEQRPPGQAETDPGRSQQLLGRAARVGGALPGGGNRAPLFSQVLEVFCLGCDAVGQGGWPPQTPALPGGQLEGLAGDGPAGTGITVSVSHAVPRQAIPF